MNFDLLKNQQNARAINSQIDINAVDDGGDSSSVILDGSKRIAKDLEGIQ